MPPLILFEKEKEYLQWLPSDDIIESYLPDMITELAEANLKQMDAFL